MKDNVEVYRVGQSGVDTIYKALKCLLKNDYKEIDVTHKDRQTARAIVEKIDSTRNSRVARTLENAGNRLGH